MMDVSVIIPNYNGAQYINKCIESIYEQVKHKKNIIVVDNHSSDNSIAEINKTFSDITIVANDKNVGFAAAVNIGIMLCDTEYVILLNNDAFVRSDFIRPLYEMINSDKSIFSVSSKMLQYSNPSLIDDAGDHFTLMGWAYKAGDGDRSEQHNKEKVIFSSCAGAAIYRRNVFEEMGYFDEKFFAYLEDVDIGFRANLFGYRNVYCPQAEVLHIGSATSGSVKHSEFKVRISSRNNVYLIVKNLPLILLIIHFPLYLIGFIIKLCYFIRLGYGKPYLLGLLEGIKNIHSVRRVKFRLKNIRGYIRAEYLMCKATFYFFSNKMYRFLR